MPHSRWTFERGLLRVDGRETLLRLAEYPYYRDDPASWRPRLLDAREAGFEAVSTYVPWRHHAPRGSEHFDFEGRTRPSRNLVGFLDEAEDVGLRVFAKPGPFVHGELPFGGLPERVCADCVDDIEAEVDASGEPLRWKLRGMDATDAHVLPAPWGARYLALAQDWLKAVGGVLRGRSGPRGLVFAVQLMNEGVYSDSSHSSPQDFAFSTSSVDRYHESREAHGSGGPPRRAGLLTRVEDLGPYLDWSAYQASFYHELARVYRAALIAGGAHPDIDVVFNFNPNGSTFRVEPGTNDGWYTRVHGVRGRAFSLGVTNWLGVLAQDDVAFRQFVMAVTAFRGPAMELNWGFGTSYQAIYEHVTPSLFETMLALACGATGYAAYVFAGTRAWLHDPNLSGAWMPPRTSLRQDASTADYPGHAAVLSTGARTPKYPTLVQLNDLLRSGAIRAPGAGPRLPVRWAVYPPYAWASQWLPRGDPDDVTWRPPLALVPRSAFHGLDAFAEMLLARGACPGQLDVSRERDRWEEARVLCIGLHEFMDLATQERLAAWVEEGGVLVATGYVPERGLDLRPAPGALAARVFPHSATARETVGPERIEIDEREALLAGAWWTLEPPADAEICARSPWGPVGYVRSVGAGRAAFVAGRVWRAALSGDDPSIARANQAAVWGLIQRLAGPGGLPARASGGAVAFERAGGLFLVLRDPAGSIACEVQGGTRVEVESPSQAAHFLAWDEGGLHAAYVRGVNDARSERRSPWARVGAETIAADTPCDVCLARAGEGWTVTVAHHRGEARVVLPRRVAREVGQAEILFPVAPEGGVARRHLLADRGTRARHAR